MPSTNDSFSMTDAVTRIAQSPMLYPQKLDLYQQALLFVRMDDSNYRAASFLDDRILTPQTQGGWILLDQLRAALNAAETVGPPLHYIFHTGHVGSTLLSRLLDASGQVFGLREPLPLRTLAETHDVLNRPESLLSPAQFDSVSATLLQLWRRAPPATAAVVIKATSSAARVGRYLLARQPASRAIYLNLRLEPYLATLLSGANSMIDLRGQAQERYTRLQAQLNAPLKPLHGFSPGELAALTWVTESSTQRAMQSDPDARVLNVDFDDFLQNTAAIFARVLAHFGIVMDAAAAARLLNGPVRQRYSKATEHPYSADTRAEVVRDSRQRNASEIAAGLRWAEETGRQHADIAALLAS